MDGSGRATCTHATVNRRCGAAPRVRNRCSAKSVTPRYMFPTPRVGVVRRRNGYPDPRSARTWSRSSRVSVSTTSSLDGVHDGNDVRTGSLRFRIRWTPTAASNFSSSIFSIVNGRLLVGRARSHSQAGHSAYVNVNVAVAVPTDTAASYTVTVYVTVTSNGIS